MLEQNIRQAFKVKRVLGVFFDLEKAYDSTWRGGVLRKLFNLGFRGFIPLFIQNLLSNRTFQVRVGNTLSRHYELEEGVPQDSVLCVLCFALAFNDVVMEVLEGISCFLYVDDFAIYVTGARLAGVERRKMVGVPSFNLYGKLIPSTDNVHFLGLVFDRRFTLDNYI